MGLLGEIIKTIAEAVAEAKQQQAGGPPRPVARPIQPPADDFQGQPLETVEASDPRHRMAEKAASQRQKADRNPQNREAARGRERSTNARSDERREEQRRDGVEAARTVAHGRIPALLRNPRTMRELIVLREILDRPLALRRHRR